MPDGKELSDRIFVKSAKSHLMLFRYSSPCEMLLKISLLVSRMVFHLNKLLNIL